jgi:hypothetical protein
MERKSNPKANSLRANRGGTRKSSQQRGMERSSRHLLMPPQILTVKTMSGVTRYLDSTGANGNFTVADLLGLPGIVAATAVLGYGIALACRLKKVEVWSPVTTAGSTISCTITDDSNLVGSLDGVFGGVPVVIQDSSMSYDRPAHIVFNPKSTRLSGAWLNTNMVQTQRLFLLQEPVGSIVDIHFEFVISTAFLQPSTSIVLVGATPGVMYKHPVIGGELIPQGVNTL